MENTFIKPKVSVPLMLTSTWRQLGQVELEWLGMNFSFTQETLISGSWAYIYFTTIKIVLKKKNLTFLYKLNVESSLATDEMQNYTFEIHFHNDWKRGNSMQFSFWFLVRILFHAVFMGCILATWHTIYRFYQTNTEQHRTNTVIII